MTRRDLLFGAAGAVTVAARAALAAARPVRGGEDEAALIAVTFDLEMSRNFPTWETTHWDYEKGNLDEAAKRCSVEAARRVKARGGRIHFFAVGRVFEQESVAWLESLVKEGHPVGNHTYDHVNVKAMRPEDVQFRFQRAPWLIEGKAPADVIAENIRMTTKAMKARLGIEPAGFRTPGGFNDGLADRPDVQKMLLDQGYAWVSSKYPAHPLGAVGTEPRRETIDGVVKAVDEARPFVYPSGLIEVPMSPVSDVTAFRGGRWKLEWFLEVLRAAVERAIERRGEFDFLAHPSCLGVVDPELRAIDLICGLVERSGGRARLATLDALAARAKRG